MAVISLVFGILGWTALPLIGTITAIITGDIARKEIARSGGAEEGDGLALAGIILGWAQIVLLLLAIGLFFLLFIGATIVGIVLKP